MTGGVSDVQSETESLSACPVCAGGDSDPVAMPEVRIGEEHFKHLLPRLAIARCRHCGLMYLNPRPSPGSLHAFYERPGYDAHTRGHGQGHDLGRMDLVSRFAKGLRLLDVGCGSGAFLETARGMGYAVAGIEPSSQGRLSAVQAGMEVHENAAGLLRDGRQFDVVTVWHVLEHVPDIHAFLRDIRLLLVRGGVVIVAVPNASSARASLLRTFPGLRPPDDEAYRAFPIHLYLFSRRNLAKLLEGCGLSVRFSTTQGFALDECFARRRSASPRAAENTVMTRGLPPAAGMRRASLLRRLIIPFKNAFFRAHLGESLVMIAAREDAPTSPRTSAG